jgi:NAD(P)-dependent dehydrogenase (short-subunit alcohol dehydrogenase family)
MLDFKGKVVAVVGAASGLGQGMATRAAQHGAQLALADVRREPLERFADELRNAHGSNVRTSVVDVRDPEAVASFADDTFANFDGVDYLMNSAGVSSMGSILRVPVDEWRLLLDINVMGLIYGIRSFVPRMIEQDRECFVVNTAAVGGLECTPFLPAYIMTKHAAVSLTESLTLELQTIGSKVKVFAYCPGMVQTNLSQNSREMMGDDPYYESDEVKMLKAIGRKALAAGISMEEAMDGFFAGLEADEFYIRTHPDEEARVKYRAEMVVAKTRPVPEARW